MAGIHLIEHEVFDRMFKKSTTDKYPCLPALEKDPQ